LAQSWSLLPPSTEDILSPPAVEDEVVEGVSSGRFPPSPPALSAELAALGAGPAPPDPSSSVGSQRVPQP
jgi:hypothetical protein